MAGPSSRIIRDPSRWREFAVYVFDRFQDDRLLRVAASLSYTSLLAIVPMIAISFAALAGFPVFAGLREKVLTYVVENFLPSSESALNAYLDSFLANTGSLTAVGIIGLAVTAILLLHTVETAFHIIFRAESERALTTRLLVYWAFLTIGPFLLGGSISLSTLLFALTEWPIVSDHVKIAGMVRHGVPNALAFAALWLFYWVIPNRPIRVLDAFIGAVTSAVLFAMLRGGFALYVEDGSLRTIYGAAATVPVFLVWMYLSWAVVLFGAEITASLDEWRRNGGRNPGIRGAGRLARGERLVLALELLRLLGSRHEGRGGGVSPRVLRRRISRGGHLIEDVLERLAKAGIAIHGGDDRWVLARSLEKLSLYDLCKALGVVGEPAHLPGSGVPDRTDPVLEALAARIDAAEAIHRDALSASVAVVLDGRATDMSPAANNSPDGG